MDKNEEKLLRAVPQLGMATVPALRDATDLDEADINGWIKKAVSDGLIAPRDDQYYTDHETPNKSGLYPSWGLAEPGDSVLTALGPPKFEDGFGAWLESKLAGS
jgi:hypothetical protein